MKKQLSSSETNDLLAVLYERFQENMDRHPRINWDDIVTKLKANPEKLWSLFQMEISGGEPDLVVLDANANDYFFVDCSAETPKNRRSCCFDQKALDGRKLNKPATNAMEMAKQMGIEILDEEQYRILQNLGKFDLKTSSWIATPENIRKLGGALFCDRRYDSVFTYHNGADSYYAARGFRGILKI
ncbi:DUF4256 domain-containing protein [Flavobacterium sp. NST-5]|uniref:DUF4256 domain-containing protein n=1 Tax=Flavobacterium ichthyis TaxID=2698827 RepID=A0ABW9Z6A0_9FLAO|nr:DUF4256 domain-containing protein [Flavobacterium ichthyis]NBL64216.1 DUF4256 domain-containing protein [Flavobacterium ichthyis]